MEQTSTAVPTGLLDKQFPRQLTQALNDQLNQTINLTQQLISTSTNPTMEAWDLSAKSGRPHTSGWRHLWTSTTVSDTKTESNS